MCNWYVYLICLDSPLSPDHTTKHYIGAALNPIERLHQHRHGRGARMLQVATERGIDFDIVRTWIGGYELEKYLKSLKCAPKLCPRCSGPGAFKRQALHTDPVWLDDDMPAMPVRAGSGYDRYWFGVMAGQRRARQISPMANLDTLDLALDTYADMWH